MKPGMFIVFEGPDGSGKSSQAKLAYEWVQRWLERTGPIPGDYQVHTRPTRVHLVKEPGNPSIQLCHDIRQMIFRKPYSAHLDAVEQGLLFFIDHYANADYVKALIDQGDIVIADRWLYSQYAYNVAKKAPQVDSIKLYRQYEPQQIQPDLVILLDAEPELLLNRLAGREGEKDVSQDHKQALWGDKEPLEVHTLIRNEYLRLADRYGNSPIGSGIPWRVAGIQWRVIHQRPDQSPKAVFEQIAIYLERFREPRTVKFECGCFKNVVGGDPPGVDCPTGLHPTPQYPVGK